MEKSKQRFLSFYLIKRWNRKISLAKEKLIWEPKLMKNIRRSRLCNNCLEKIYFQVQVGRKYCDSTNVGIRMKT